MQNRIVRSPVSFQIFASLALLALTSAGSVQAQDVAKKVDFAREVKPILANHCWNCHGPDEKTRQAGLRLDDQTSATSTLESGMAAIVPSDASKSSLLARIDTDDHSLLMPPAETQKPLSEKQKQTLRKWIEEGAEFSEHWAFIPPVRPAIPAVQKRDWPRNEIDYFVLATLEANKLSPNSEAEKGTWLRRVTLDMTGLPPTLDELEAFLADQSESAYESVVDRLFKSPHYAERQAMLWLDGARYADTNGYNNDEVRTMWPWRDWLIRSFQEGLPYDQFVIQQLAGDLLPNATIPQKVATGFVRNHVLTTEGGIIPEEYQAEYVADRIHTTSTVFLGLSMQCARCHDHKYDPFTQRDYYRMAAFFNNVPDNIVGYSQGKMAEPLLKVPSPEQQAELERLSKETVRLKAALAERRNQLDTELVTWEQKLTPTEKEQLGAAGLVTHFAFLEKEGDSFVDSRSSGRVAKGIGSIARSEGKLNGAIELDGSNYLEQAEVGDFEADQAFSFAVWQKLTSSEASTALSRMDEANSFRGYDLILESGKVAVHIVETWPEKAFKVVTKNAISLNEWHHIVVVYDGSKKASGLKIYVDNVEQQLDVTNNNSIETSIRTDKPFHIGRRTTSAPFRGAIDDIQVYSKALTAEEVKQLHAGSPIGTLKDLLAKTADQRTSEEKELLKDYFFTQVDPQARQLRADADKIPALQAELDKAIPVTMIMGEMANRRKTFILKRGQYDQLGEEVTAGLPNSLSGGMEVPANNRLELANWLTSPNHPLTARVAVNRWWEQYFGTGIVETSEDFGVQGSPPSHPELLDWLSKELIENGWDQREIMKKIVLSATYRQSSRATAELLQIDPMNRLLTRGPRNRLPAELVRDNALAISGLLQRKIGGPSVKPYQPAGLWEDVSVERRESYVPDQGEGLYRRSMYTFWKRTCPPPSMSTFDAPDRETCVVRRARTNTPLQALVLLNDPTYLEASRNLATKLLKELQADEARLEQAFLLSVARKPSATEEKIVLQALTDARLEFRQSPAEAESYLKIGNTPRDTELDLVELAAWTSVANLILNLDETISKP